MILRVIVVDDEPPARRRLARLVAAAGAEVVAEADDADSAVARIAELDPDVVLLDVRMPGRDGVALARELGPRPVVVFTTAHAEHAVDAFDAAAADYLLKPVAADKLARALDRARERLRTLDAPADVPTVAVRLGDAVRYVPVTAIARFRAEQKYTAFVVDGVEHLCDEPLAALEERLPGFVRVHRGELVQLARIRAVVGDGDGAEVVLDDGQRARVSRRMLPELRRRLR